MDNKETQDWEETKETAQTVGSFIWDLAKVFLIALAIIVPIRVFVAEPFIVSGSSMVPNFHNREYLVVDKLTYRKTEPQRGDVIVLKYPKHTSEYFIKRIIGLPGETIKIADGGVYIFNKETPAGFRLNEPYLPKQDITFWSGDPITLGEGEYFVLGDNRLASSDSRVWGILPKIDIVGRAWARVFPLNEFGILTGKAY